jgi:Mrp family chromosome partitioning ATPase
VRSIKSALERLKMAGGAVLGVIVTKIDINSQLYGYSYGYGYGKKYGYGDGLSYGSKAAGRGTDAAGTQAA